ncbi:histidine kinase [Streptomyces viridochromogenes]|uniref:histidine kinase n=1 Tax=Streptomyces viridochromogenes TaxID=1938 RepID=A0A0J7Z5A4_STRVR|nr:histidine kinase [Streptomyces viridochromogenes]KMS70939.1 histidine kinase [Streptomyces viridochromogenes]KOG13340.1 histidine kinase [Streptomyces viridochromogenes]KOG13444.1 histidine kinase [Streptomyces viridochromogenes]
MSRARAVWQRVPAPVVDIVLVAVAAVDVLVVDMWEHTRLEVTLAAVGCAALAFRRRFPLGVFLLTLPIALMQDVAVAVLAALFTLAERSRNRRLLAVCVVLAAVASSTPWPLAAEYRTMTLVFFVYGLATSVAPVLFGQLLQARRDLARRLAEVEEAREHERTLHAQAVLARERAQLAREMHDVVSHQVSLIAVRAGALQVAAKDADAKEAARTIRSLSVTTLDELRTMVTLLRASGGKSTELTPQPTLADLRKLVESSGTHTELTGELPPTVGTPAQRALYRTVQEALTNVRKHAPGANARVELWQDGDGIGVTVTNTPPTRPSLSLPGSQQGLVGLRERAEILHGTLDAGPTAQGGYRVRLWVPLSAD